MSNDGMMLLTISGVTPEEFFKRFGEVAQRFGYVLGPIAEVVREAEFNLPEAVTIGDIGARVGMEPFKSFAFASGRSSSAESPQPDPKKRRTRRTRAQIEADNAAREAERLPDDPSPPTIAELSRQIHSLVDEGVNLIPPAELTIADVKLAGGRLLQANNGDPAPLRELLATYGVVRMTPLPEEHWAEFISKCDQGGAA